MICDHPDALLCSCNPALDLSFPSRSGEDHILNVRPNEMQERVDALIYDLDRRKKLSERKMS